MNTIKGKNINIDKLEYIRVVNEFKTNLKSIMTEEEVEKLIAMDFSSSAVRKRKKKRDN